jgi:murein DD-endopeptidase MepM/ murein hydrolase activator NlpD
MTIKKVNVSARQARHAQIDFRQGVYYQNQQENKRVFRRFLLKTLVISGLLIVFYLVSFQFVVAYPEINGNQAVNLDLNASEIYILSDSGFVLKPATQTSKGDRSTANEVIDYTVEPGDTIFGIAAKFSLHAQTVIDNNPGTSKWSTLKIGKKLKILPVDGILHTFTSKDKLTTVAKKYKVKVEDVLRQNKLSESDLIVDKTLIIPGAKKPVVVRSVWKGGSAPRYAPSIYTGLISGSYIWPANGKITQYYHRWHYALDIANRNKGPIYAVANGVVIKAQGGWNGGYGRMIIIDHGNGLKTLYAHNEKLYVKVGDNVSQGQTIAWMGNTGRVRGATGIHLHFEVIHNGIKKNPLAYIGTR